MWDSVLEEYLRAKRSADEVSKPTTNILCIYNGKWRGWDSVLEEYLRAKKDAKIVAEENYNGFIYWATKESRDVPFENTTAWVTVLERYRTKSR